MGIHTLEIKDLVIDPPAGNPPWRPTQLRGFTWRSKQLHMKEFAHRPLNAVVVEMTVDYPDASTYPEGKTRCWDWQLYQPGTGFVKNHLGTRFVTPQGLAFHKVGSGAGELNYEVAIPHPGDFYRYVANFATGDVAIGHKDFQGSGAGVVYPRKVGEAPYELKVGFDGKGEPKDGWWEGTRYSGIKLTLYTGDDLFSFDGDVKPEPEPEPVTDPGEAPLAHYDLMSLGAAYLHGLGGAAYLHGLGAVVADQGDAATHADRVADFYERLKERAS